MALLTKTPEQDLTIQGVRLQWTSAYQYLGVWIDRKLTFRREVDYLRERASSRISVMRRMTTTRAGATHRVLRLCYVQAVRSLLDHAAVALVALSDGATAALERLQNDAMRHMLGAPRWTKLHTLRDETGLPPLELRIDELVAAFVARTVGRTTDTPARQRLITALPQAAELFRETWACAAARAAPRSLPGVGLVGRGPDTKAEDYVDPPPWAEAAADIYIASLPHGKAMCSREDLLQRAKDTIAHTGEDAAGIYYTDGSVDQENSRTAAAVVFGRKAFGWRTSDHCSTLQTELVAITAALQFVEHQGRGKAVVYTDSMTSLQTLRTAAPKDNVKLVTFLLQKLTHETQDDP